MSNVPNHETHTPIKVTIPAEDEILSERAVLHTPSLWQMGVKVTHKASRREGVVRVVDYRTNQFRLVGDPRTIWQACDEWDVLVEKTPEERGKDEARETLRAEIEALDAEVLPLVEVLCDDADPLKALAKLRAMRRAGMLGATPPPAEPEKPKRVRSPKPEASE